MRSKRKHRVIYQILGMVGIILTVPYFTFSQHLNKVNETPLQYENTLTYNFEGDYLTSVNTMSDSNYVQNGWNIIQFKQYDNEYNVINETRFQDSMYVYLQGTNVDYLDGEYYFSGWRRELFSASEAQGFIAKFDESGNLLWLETYFPLIEETKIEHFKIIEGRTYIAGTHRDIANSLQHPFLSEIDSSGEIIWTVIFDGFDSASITKLQTTSDGLLLSGRYVVQGSSNQRVALYKLDYNGNIQWQKTYGSTGSWIINNLAPYELSNGNILMYGYTTDPITELHVDSWLVLADNQGNTLKDSIFVFSSNDDHFHIHYSPPIIRENDFLLLGYIRESGTSPRNAYLACIDFDFNIKWIRTYGERESKNRLTFIHDLGNDFYLLSGVVDDDDDHSTTDEWFVVVDSMGCDVTECYLGLEEENSETVSFSVYPNPATNNITIEFTNSAKSNATNYQLIDLSGKVVQKSNLINSKLDVSNLESGIYYLRLEQKGNHLGSRKVVIK